MGNLISMRNLADAYESGEYVEKNINRSIEYYETLGINGDIEAFMHLFEIFFDGKVIQKSPERSFIYYKYIRLLSIEPDHKYIDKMKKYTTEMEEIFSTKVLDWQKEYHSLWKCSEGLQKNILTILLVSKHRKESVIGIQSILIKGIMMNIIKYACNYDQK